MQGQHWWYMGAASTRAANADRQRTGAGTNQVQLRCQYDPTSSITPMAESFLGHFRGMSGERCRSGDSGIALPDPNLQRAPPPNTLLAYMCNASHRPAPEWRRPIGTQANVHALKKHNTLYTTSPWPQSIGYSATLADKHRTPTTQSEYRVWGHITQPSKTLVLMLPVDVDHHNKHVHQQEDIRKKRQQNPDEDGLPQLEAMPMTCGPVNLISAPMPLAILVTGLGHVLATALQYCALATKVCPWSPLRFWGAYCQKDPTIEGKARQPPIALVAWLQ